MEVHHGSSEPSLNFLKRCRKRWTCCINQLTVLQPRPLSGKRRTLVALGLLWPRLDRLGLGLVRLPGDIPIQRNGSTHYFPVTTAIPVSVVLSLILRPLGR